MIKLKNQKSILLTSLSIATFIFTMYIFILFKQSENAIELIPSFESNNFDNYKIIVSETQSLISSEILMKTLDFAIKDVDENDPELVKFVQTLIHQPSSMNKLNLKNNLLRDFSQIGQSSFIDSLLNKKRNGFFIECGGFDGETHSNSLYFELERNWTGLLIEAVPKLHEQIINKNRNVYSINACLSKGKPSVEKIIIANEHALSGRLKEMSKDHMNRISNDEKVMEIVYVPCFSLNTILKAINVNRVDYFSLDIEGGELDVLTSIDYNKIDIRTFSIEHNGESDRKFQMINYLSKNMFILKKDDYQDVYFVKA